MSTPFYVAPEQQMKDRADFARKGIGRGRSVVVMHYADGILFVAENRSQALHKVSEIYDRIGFAAVGRYNEFENLRTAGIRYADLRGYSYDRTDVTGRGLANAYAQLLGTIFSSGGEKPYEVEIVVAELGATDQLDQIYRLTYDGSVADETDYAVMGGSADVITEVIRRDFRADLSLVAAIRLAVGALGADGGPNAPARELGVEALEVAILDRTRALPRKFRRLRGERLAELLRGEPETGEPDRETPAQLAPQPLPETELPTGGTGAGPSPGSGDQPAS
ncbi:proteasome subunit alpha [Microlunatus lacustris]